MTTLTGELLIKTTHRRQPRGLNERKKQKKHAISRWYQRSTTSLSRLALRISRLPGVGTFKDLPCGRQLSLGKMLSLSTSYSALRCTFVLSRSWVFAHYTGCYRAGLAGHCVNTHCSSGAVDRFDVRLPLAKIFFDVIQDLTSLVCMLELGSYIARDNGSVV